jgi:TorA maturation chaperone TorD
MSNHNSPTLSPGEVALARHHTYALLSRLFFEGLTAELRPYAVELVGEAATTTGFNADEAAAAHHNLFRFNVFPFQAIFRDASGLLGGEESGRVRAAYAEAGFRVDAEPDQIGHELGLLAFLCGAEAEARQDGREEAAAHARRLQKGFLQAHLLLWLPPFAAALERAGQPFYAALAALTLDSCRPRGGAGRATGPHRPAAARAARPAGAGENGPQGDCRLPDDAPVQRPLPQSRRHQRGGARPQAAARLWRPAAVVDEFAAYGRAV